MNHEFETLEDIEKAYREISAVLLERIAQRDELVKLLKIARPSMVLQIQQDIARFDDAIESAEDCLETIAKIRETRIELDHSIANLLAFTDKIKPILFKHLAEHHPEKIEEFEILFNHKDSIKTH